jgi:hypothetical protein
VNRLAHEPFLGWLDEGFVLDNHANRVSAKNVYSLESSALDAFYLSQADTIPKPQTEVSVKGLQEKIVHGDSTL